MSEINQPPDQDKDTEQGIEPVVEQPKEVVTPVTTVPVQVATDPNKDKRLFAILGTVILIALIIAAVVLLVNNKPESSVEESQQQEQEESVVGEETPENGGEDQVTDPSGESAEAVLEGKPGTALDNGGIPLNSDLTAGAYTDDVPVVEVYLDFACPYCGEFEKTNAEGIKELLKDKDAGVVYHVVAMMDESEDLTGFSGEAANAAATVAEYDPEKYFDMTAALFELQEESFVAEQEPTVEDIEQVATEVGVSDDVVDKFAAGEFKEWVWAKTINAFEEGLQGTPTVLIDDEPFENWIEPGALAGAVEGSEGSVPQE